MNTTQPKRELATNDLAPDFDLPATNGKHVRLSALRGAPIVLFFYPQDGSQTCTAEAIAFSEAASRLRAAGATIFGISPDSMKRHENFKAKHGLAIELISDEQRSAINAYGLWMEKTTFGHVHMGVDRSTFLIDRDGRIAALWRKVRLKGHVDEVIKRLDDLNHAKQK
ncbi:MULTISPECIES: peroxiredoxin [Mesorhizobium]|uniref:thioredoxin-dependent peroxiredoxin n=1 Tax=Mesorhizobium denitrificans TaxID=2294114 RepID=A0A371X1Z0_9HYPH|nr:MULTISPECIES: peroxiredoxin [Mesorhizobium]RFC63243.1 peroxiredoxin [Mesorhizobium denitrificans]